MSYMGVTGFDNVKKQERELFTITVKVIKLSHAPLRMAA